MRVVILEDHALLQEGLGLLLGTAGFEVAAAVGTVEEFVTAVDAEPPDIAVVDIRLPPTFRDEGLRAAIDARTRHPRLPILVLSQYIERVYATELLADRRGGVGYLLKNRISRVDDFIDAVHRVAAGGTALDPDVVAQLLITRGPAPLECLTPREREVLALMAEGHANTAIAAKLFLTERAISKHIGNIFRKLELPVDDSAHRRVRAVMKYLSATADPS